VIGRDNDLPWRIREDLQRFKQLTLGHTLVMGRKTYDSIGRTLPGRTTVVVTRQGGWSAPDVLVAHSLEQALEMADDAEVFVAGGGEIYAQALPLADAMVLTEVEQSPEAEVFFPEVDPRAWREVSREAHDGFSFVSYRRARASA
jgi:dihydrofolate reductase